MNPQLLNEEQVGRLGQELDAVEKLNPENFIPFYEQQWIKGWKVPQQWGIRDLPIGFESRLASEVGFRGLADPSGKITLTREGIAPSIIAHEMAHQQWFILTLAEQQRATQLFSRLERASPLFRKRLSDAGSKEWGSSPIERHAVLYQMSGGDFERLPENLRSFYRDLFGERQPSEQPEQPTGTLTEQPPVSPVSDVVTAPFSPELAERAERNKEAFELSTAEPPRESVFETIRKAWTLSSVRGVETTVQAFLNIVPELLIPDPVPISERSPTTQAELRDPRIRAQVERQMEISQSIKDTAKQKATESLADYNRWVVQHPELAPDPKFTEGAFKNPELWKDPNWWGYAIGNMAPQAATALSAGTLATMATGGNVFAGAVAAGLTFAPLEVQGVFDDLITEGIPRDQAAELAFLVTVPIVLTESASTFLQFTRFMPQIRQIFRQTATREIIKLTKRQLVKKGLTTFTTLQFTETMEEVVQQALGNTAVIMAGKDRELFAGVPEMLPEVTAGVAPFSLIGAGASTLTIPSSLTQDVQVPEGVKEAVREERGSITLPGGEEQPTVESVAAKIAANQVLTPAERQFYANQAQEIETALQAQAQEVTPTPEQVVTPTTGAEGVVPDVAPEITAESRLNISGTQGNRLALQEAGIEFEQTNPTLAEIATELDKIQAQIDAVPTSQLGKPKHRRLDNGRAIKISGEPIWFK